MGLGIWIPDRENGKTGTKNILYESRENLSCLVKIEFENIKI